MTQLPILNDDQLGGTTGEQEHSGFGALKTIRGCLPLAALDVRASVAGLVAEIRVRQTFVNTSPEPIEATYLFPLPDRAALTAFQMRIGERLIDGVLKERAEARQAYDEALRAGHRAGIAEENRPDVFSLRVGNLMPGDQISVFLTLVGPLEYSDAQATFRFPLVVAPRYIPGSPLPGPPVGPGVAEDTSLVPDASQITPPVLLPGFPNPVRLSLSVEFDPAGLPLADLESSLHAVETTETSGRKLVRLVPGERLNRDFILRWAVADKTGADQTRAQQSIKSNLILAPDAQRQQGTFLLTLVPPAATADRHTPRDVVLVLDRSGSMGGWKIVAARRAAARIVDSLTAADRLAVLAFDDVIERPKAISRSSLWRPATAIAFEPWSFSRELTLAVERSWPRRWPQRPRPWPNPTRAKSRARARHGWPGRQRRPHSGHARTHRPRAPNLHARHRSGRQRRIPPPPGRTWGRHV